VQYTAKATQELLKDLEFQQSVHWRQFPTREEARQAIFAYIEGFYNTRRVQKRLGYLSPMEWLNHYTGELMMSVA
jgi:transposase InsO family protein